MVDRTGFRSPLSGLASVCCALAAALPAQQAAATAWRAKAEQAVAGKREAIAAPAISCAIARADGTVLFACGVGLADVENEVPATAATVYRLASISKPITAVCALALAEHGRLDLDRDLHESVPEWPQKQWPVTARQLLGHLGGVRHYNGEAESTLHFANQRAGLVRFAADPLLHEPGTKYLYSTYGFNLVAAAVEVAAQQPFPQVVRELVAAPSGAATLQDDDPRRVIPHRAQGYERVAGELRNSELMDASYKLGGGGLCSSAEDLARFGAALIGGRLLRKESLAAMWTPQRLADGSTSAYGLGIGVGGSDGHRVLQHSGAQSRVSTYLRMLPDDGLVVALLCNLEGVRLGDLATELVAIAR